MWGLLVLRFLHFLMYTWLKKVTKTYSNTDLSTPSFPKDSLVLFMESWCKRVKFYKVMSKHQKMPLLKLLLILLLWLIYWYRSWMVQLSCCSTEFRSMQKKANMNPKCLQLKHQNKFASNFGASIVHSTINIYLHFSRQMTVRCHWRQVFMRSCSTLLFHALF